MTTEVAVIPKDPRLSEVPEGFVPQGYLMNPETDIVISGRQLQNGMIVLLEENLMREDASTHDESTHELARVRAMATSRWCVIRDLSSTSDRNRVRKFIGIYEGGVEISRTYHEDYYWIVKKNSF